MEIFVEWINKENIIIHYLTTKLDWIKRLSLSLDLPITRLIKKKKSRWRVSSILLQAIFYKYQISYNMIIFCLSKIAHLFKLIINNFICRSHIALSPIRISGICICERTTWLKTVKNTEVSFGQCEHLVSILFGD